MLYFHFFFILDIVRRRMKSPPPWSSLPSVKNNTYDDSFGTLISFQQLIQPLIQEPMD